MSNSSLSSVVSSLVRASMGTSVSSSVTDEELDRHVAELILKEAKQKAERYLQEGVRAYLPDPGPDVNVPRTNKRFLSAILRNMDEHNRAVLRAQDEAAEEVRVEREEREERERQERRARRARAREGTSTTSAAERIRRLMGGARRRGETSIEGRGGRGRSHGRRAASREDRGAGEDEDGKRRRRWRRRRRRRTHGGREEEEEEEEAAERRRSRSRSPRRNGHRDRDASLRAQFEQRRTATAAASEPASPTLSEEEDIERTRPGVRVQGRGRRDSGVLPVSLAAAPSKMDKYFEASYDPRLDTEPLEPPRVPATGLIDDGAYAGWDAMLELIRQRREERAMVKQGGGHGHGHSHRKGKSSLVDDTVAAAAAAGGHVQYGRRGEVREWDVGKGGP